MKIILPIFAGALMAIAGAANAAFCVSIGNIAHTSTDTTGVMTVGLHASPGQMFTTSSIPLINRLLAAQAGNLFVKLDGEAPGSTVTSCSRTATNWGGVLTSVSLSVTPNGW